MDEKTAAKAGSKRVVKYKKAPGAPKRFKSPFIFFSTEKHREIRASLGERSSSEKTTNVAKLVAEEWRKLSPQERQVWDERARLDKERFEREKETYDGPWKVVAHKKSQKDPSAPKRPMSAFLAFSNGKRAEMRRKRPFLNNGEISRLLADMWKELPDAERKLYIDEEYALRQEYKTAMNEWRESESAQEYLEAQQEMTNGARQHQQVPLVGQNPFAAASVPVSPSSYRQSSFVVPPASDSIFPTQYDGYGDMYHGGGWMPPEGAMQAPAFSSILLHKQHAVDGSSSYQHHMYPGAGYYGHPADYAAAAYDQEAAAAAAHHSYFPGSLYPPYPTSLGDEPQQMAAYNMAQLHGLQVQRHLEPMPLLYGGDSAAAAAYAAAGAPYYPNDVDDGSHQYAGGPPQQQQHQPFDPPRRR